MSSDEPGARTLEPSRGPLLAVTGSKPPYIFDLPQLLSLPTGFEFRFRYRHKWVDQGLVRRIVDHGETFAGREMVILFHSQESKRLIPVRRGTVIRLEAIGPMIHLRFRVSEFPRVSLNVESYSRSELVDTHLALTTLRDVSKGLVGPIAGSDRYDLSNPLPDGYYVRDATRGLVGAEWDSDDATAWARLAAILHEEPSLNGIPLFYLLGFRGETGKVLAPGPVKNRYSFTREEIFGFPLVESERYRMRVLEWSEPPRGGAQQLIRVRCEYDKTRLLLEGASDLVVGRYDVIEFRFSAVRSGYSEVALRAEAEERRERVGTDNPTPVLPAWTAWPSIFAARVPVIVQPRALPLVLAALVSVVGAAVYLFVAPQVVNAQGRAFLELIAIGLVVSGTRGLAGLLSGLISLRADLKRLWSGSESES
jgi:hypothetical protein